MSRRPQILAAETRPSLSRGVRMALSYLALFVFTAFALYPISRIVTIALRPGDQLLSSSLAGAPRTFATALHLAPGMRGRSLTILRPSGEAEFENHVVDVITEGEFIAPETPVTIISTDGMHVVVREVDPVAIA